MMAGTPPGWSPLPCLPPAVSLVLFINNSDVLERFIFQISVGCVVVLKAWSLDSSMQVPPDSFLEMQVLEPHPTPPDFDAEI